MSTTLRETTRIANASTGAGLRRIGVRLMMASLLVLPLAYVLYLVFLGVSDKSDPLGIGVFFFMVCGGGVAIVSALAGALAWFFGRRADRARSVIQEAV